ncbi:hypothetical protein ACPPVO_43160 [Dactylosporangium sp. McL0621]|uniref:hypothetical protein n=1 Tax=Dactylosporangium sp. McL0621 TaxID=3415678 RepID=UPI003CF35CC0
MQFIAVYVVGLVVAAVAAWRSSDRSALDWVVLTLPAVLFVPAAVFAVFGYRADAAGPAGRRALVLAVLGAGLLAAAGTVWRET